MNFSPARGWRQAYWWLIPVLFCLYFHRQTLGLWFRADDFAWLGLRLSIHRPPDLLKALFEPMAQGTVRFLSERAFFLSFEWLFGLNALPYRIAILVVQVASCGFLAAVTKRLTNSTVAAILAPMLWTVMAGLSSAIGWLSSTNQIFFGLFFLAAFWCYLERRWVVCWIVFVLGLGTLESMVVFPAVCLAHALLLDRERIRGALWLLVPSTIFLILHFAVIPKLKTDPAYWMYFSPSSLLDTLIYYWDQALAGGRVTRVAGTIFIVAVFIVVVVVWRAVRRDFLPLFGLLWFFAMLAPVLPLRDHRMLYYLAAPGMALGFLLAVSAAPSWKLGSFFRIVPIVVVVLFVIGNVPKSREILAWHKERTVATRRLVDGVQTAEHLQNGKTILLTGISNALFWDAVFDNPFRLLGIRRVYLAPGAEKPIDSHPEWGGINEWIIPPNAVRQLFVKGDVAVYTPDGESLKNITAEWRGVAEQLTSELSAFVDVGDPSFAAQLKSGWYALEGSSRWMSRRGEVVLSTTRAVTGELVVAGYCPEALVVAGGVELSAVVDGRRVGTRAVSTPNSPFEVIFQLDQTLRGRESVVVAIEASRTIRPRGDSRELSLVFGTIQAR